jgi:hypothetical protein
MATEFDCFTRRLPKDPDRARATEALLAAAVAAHIRSPLSARRAAKALHEATGAEPRDAAAMLDLLERPCEEWLPRADELGVAGESLARLGVATAASIDVRLRFG